MWAIRGNSLIPDRYFLSFCVLAVLIPNVFLAIRMRTAKTLNEKRELIVGAAEDHRDHLLVYLFAMLLPFYAPDVGTWRAFGATVAALGFIVFLFWHLNLHYMNVVFALVGLRVFTVYPPSDANPVTGRASQVLITRRATIPAGSRVIAYRLSDTVYLEATSETLIRPRQDSND
jgi:hypothetical protein